MADLREDGEQVAMLEMLARVGPDGFDQIGRLPRRLSKAACCLLHPGQSLRQPGLDPSYAQSAEPDASPTDVRSRAARTPSSLPASSVIAPRLAACTRASSAALVPSGNDVIV